MTETTTSVLTIEPILEGQGLVKKFGRVVALDHLNFSAVPRRGAGRDRRQWIR